MARGPGSARGCGGVLLDFEGDRRIGAYEAAGGYEMLAKAVGMTTEEIVAESTRRKCAAAAAPASHRPQGELPGAGPAGLLVRQRRRVGAGHVKDRELILRNPHAMIEGILIMSWAIRAAQAFIYIRGEYLTEYEVLVAAVAQARARGWVNHALPGTDYTPDIVVHRGAGAYICGEETALLNSLNGKRGQPTAKPPFPAVAGAFKKPTLLNNVETLATVPYILRMGGERVRRDRHRAVEGHARVLALGPGARPGNYELPLTATFRDLIEGCGGGMLDGRSLKCFVPGGSSMPVLMPDQLDIGLAFEAVAAAGSMSGSGGVIVIDDRTCMVQFALRTAEFYRHESCGKCTPCREGTRWTVELLTRIEPASARAGRSTSCSTSATGSRASACARWATPARCRSARTSCASARSSRSTCARALPVPSDRRSPRSRPWRRSLKQPRPPLVPEAGAAELAVAGERLMAATEAIATVTLTVDGRSVTVPKGTPLVIAAAEAGVEVPVFCYEPRLGAPIGACRMCLVEIEGMPKLQAGCTMTATDGMVVRTAHAPSKAKDGQDAVLEFILLNHPLDCPVCDKGGECPLQDLTFRYGPGTRA